MLSPIRRPLCGLFKAACLARFGTLRLAPGAPVLCSDNSLLLQSWGFYQTRRDYCLQQEFITTYTPEQSDMIERFWGSLKEECIWQHAFQTFEDARRIIRDWGWRNKQLRRLDRTARSWEHCNNCRETGSNRIEACLCSRRASRQHPPAECLAAGLNRMGSWSIVVE